MIRIRRSHRHRTSHEAVALLAWTIALAFAGPIFAQEAEAQGWTPELSMRYRAIRQTAISPDGAHVAFVVRTPEMEGSKSDYVSQIWMADVASHASAQWTRGESSASSPAFTPDGAWLTFTTSRDGGEGGGGNGKGTAHSQIWALPMTGGEAHPITAAEGDVGAYRLSPDGSRIAFLMRDPQTAEEKKAREEKRDVILVDKNYKYAHLYVVAFRPSSDEPATPVRLTAGDFHVTGFSWAPDGGHIAFAYQADPRINTGRLSGDLSTVTVPTVAEIDEIMEAHEAAEPEGAGGEDAEPAGGAGGEDAGREDAEPAGGADAVDHPAAVGEVTPLVKDAGVESSPRWSPDGRWIAFVSTGSQIEPIGLGDLYVIAASGGTPRKLVETPDRSGGLIDWSADSRELFVGEELGTRRDLIAVPLEGEEIRTVASGDGVLGAVSMTPGTDRMAFTWQTTDQPWDVYVSSTSAYAPTKLTDLHADVPRPTMGRTELVTWTSPDGLSIEGLLTYPVGYEAGERVPLILNVHGGPAGAHAQSFTGAPSVYMLQTFAQKGYAILRPNPRGSTGYGKEFRYANFQDWGFGDYQDLMAGVDHVIEMGVADPDRLLLMGWSYGGYMTSWAVTQTDRFKAASMGAGLPDLISMTTTTDIQDYLVGHMGVEFWEDYDLYERHSAIYHIANVVTPTQVIHGAQDRRVPTTQGQEFYRALGRLGVPTEMIVYPRTPHGPREPKFLMDVTGRILAWFGKYVGGEVATAGAGG